MAILEDDDLETWCFFADLLDDQSLVFHRNLFGTISAKIISRRRKAFGSSSKSYGHNSNDDDDGKGPEKKCNAIDDHGQQWILLVKVYKLFHRY